MKYLLLAETTTYSRQTPAASRPRRTPHDRRPRPAHFNLFTKQSRILFNVQPELTPLTSWRPHCPWRSRLPITLIRLHGREQQLSESSTAPRRVLTTTRGRGDSHRRRSESHGLGVAAYVGPDQHNPSTHAKHCDVELPGTPGPPVGFAEDPSPVKPSLGGDSAGACRVRYRSTGSSPSSWG